MNPMFTRFLKQLESRGLDVRPGNAPGELLLYGPAAEKTPEVMKALKAFKPDLLAFLRPCDNPPQVTTTCGVCGRVTDNDEDRARLEDPAFCDRGHSPRCPHKPSFHGGDS